MRLSEIKNYHIARAILILLGVLICLGALYSYIDRREGNTSAGILSGDQQNSPVENQSGQQVVQNNHNGQSGRTIPPHTALVTIRDTGYFVELATNDAERAKGLGGRESLASNGGMLFVFEEPDLYTFWMKDTRIPLDMIWISADKKIVYIKENAQPGSYPEAYGPREAPQRDALYVLEVAGGESAKNFFQVGDAVSFSSAELR